MLRRFQTWVIKNYRSLFLFLSTCVLATGAMTLQDNYLLKSDKANLGLVSLEINTSNTIRDTILYQWNSNYKNVLVYTNSENYPIRCVNGIEAANNQNYADIGFIFSYVSLLLLLILKLREGSSGAMKRLPAFWTKFFLWLVLLAGLMDGFEDVGIWYTLRKFFAAQSLPDTVIIGYPSRIKWLLLTIILLLIVYKAIQLKKISAWLELISYDIKSTLNILWRFRIVFFTLLILFLVLFVSDQGQDLLLTINASGWGCLWFLTITSIIALLCWHLPKSVEPDQSGHLPSFSKFLLGPIDFKPVGLVVTSNSHRPKGKLDMARLLGCLGFLIPATGILQTMQAYHINYPLSSVPPFWLLIILIIFYAIILRQNWIEAFFKNKSGRQVIRYRFYIATMLALFTPVVASLIGFATGLRQPYFLLFLSLDLIFLSLIFLITATLRTCFLSFYNWPVAPVIIFSGFTVLLLFIASNWPSFLHHLIDKSRFYTIPLVFSGVASYLLFFYLLLFIGKKTGIYFITFLFLFTFLLSVARVSNYHAVAIKSQAGYEKSLDTLDKYAKDWLLSRKKEIALYSGLHPNLPYPVFFVNAHGGGIRAAVWTTMVIGELDSVLRSYPSKFPSRSGFQHYAFSYSGASGGTIGLALLCGSRAPHALDPQKDHNLYPYQSINKLPGSIALYQTDNLTSDIIALLGRDMLLSLLPISGISDRGRLMEQDWEKNAGANGIDIRSRIGEIWGEQRKPLETKGRILGGKNYEIPLLFANTYDVHTGKKGISAPVVLDTLDFPGVIFLNQSPEISDPGDLRLSTAAFLSARFPFVSPTGKIKLSHFTDGGTIENSGAETELQVIQVFQRVRKELVNDGDTIFKHISINILSLPNEVKGVDSPEQEKSLFEPFAPLLGILTMGGANAAKAELINSRLNKKENFRYISFQPAVVHNKNDKLWPVLPLGWQISDFALIMMDKSVNRYPSELDTVLHRFGINR